MSYTNTQEAQCGDQTPPVLTVPHTEWKYEMRRHAQLIIPGLYMGPAQSAMNKQEMLNNGITHVLCVRDKKERQMVKPRFPETFRYHILEMSDSDDEKIISSIPDCLRFIDQALSSGSVVLAHCISGISLSPAIVISYLMTKYTWGYEQTLSFVQGRRYCVSPMSFTNQLKEYEPIYKAMKIYGNDPSSGGDRAGKRGHDQLDVDQEMTEGRVRCT